MINLKILNPQFFLEKSKKIGFNFLVQLAGQISENNIQEFLIGSQFEKLGIIFKKSIEPSYTVEYWDLS